MARKPASKKSCEKVGLSAIDKECREHGFATSERIRLVTMACAVLAPLALGYSIANEGRLTRGEIGYEALNEKIQSIRKAYEEHLGRPHEEARIELRALRVLLEKAAEQNAQLRSEVRQLNATVESLRLDIQRVEDGRC